MERGDWVRKVVCPDVLADCLGPLVSDRLAVVVGRVLAGKAAILAAVP